MKGKRVVALILAGCLTFGQTVYAEDTGEKETNIEQTNVMSEEIQGEEEVQGAGTENIQSTQEVEETLEDSQKSVEETQSMTEAESDEIATNEDWATEIKLYTDMKKTVENNTEYPKDFGWSVENDNAEACDVEIKLVDSASGNTILGQYCYVEFKTKKAGEANIKIRNELGVAYTYHVVVTQRPENSIVFRDDALENALLTSYPKIDENDDGIISKEELAKVEYLYLSYRNITDLEGLQYAENLNTIYLRGNENLESIEPLLNLKHINSYNLTNTGIPESEKWKVVKFNTDIEVNLGDKANLIANGEFFDADEELNIEKVKGDDVVEITDYTILATKIGDEQIKVSRGGHSQIINIKVVGIEADQEVNEPSDSTVKDRNKYTILNSNGELWEVYPEAKKVGNDVKRYIGGWVYSGDDNFEYAYQLRNDDTLWSENTKLAENVKAFSGHYVLNDNEDLVDVYNTDSETIENVITWAEYYQYDYYNQTRTEWCFVLKKDGTLWKRTEVGKESIANKFEKIAQNVKDLNNQGYLDNNGKYTSFSGQNNLENVETMPVGYGNGQYYTGTDGHTYYQMWGQWIDFGEIQIIDFCSAGQDNYCLTDSGEIYNTNSIDYKKVVDHAKKLMRVYINGFAKAVYQGDDGLWRSIDEQKVGTKENPVAFMEMYNNMNEYILEDYGVASDYDLTKNGVLILNHVKDMIKLDDGRSERKMFAIRTDGTLWNITGIPEMVLDLNSGTALTGDVNGDGEVNIQDLRLILRHVCGKEEFNTSQQNLADVDTNGVVDIQDLRIVLRYVCGKEEEL